MLEWLKRRVVLQVVKGLLDIIPLDGKKTVIGLIILVLGTAAQYITPGETASVIAAILDMLKSLSYDHLEETGIGILVLGLAHKALKWIFPDKSTSR